MAELPSVGAAPYRVERSLGKATVRSAEPAVGHSLSGASGLVDKLLAGDGLQCLAGQLCMPIVVDDPGDSWGTGLWRYQDEVGRFEPSGRPTVAEDGPVRKITEATFSFASSRILVRTIAYSSWPVLELRFRVAWSERQKRLKLVIPTIFRDAEPECEIPGGSISRPTDGDQHVHGRWLLMAGQIAGQPAAIGVVNSGQHGVDCRAGIVTLSVLRSAAYCHEQGQSLDELPATLFMDQGIHQFRLLVTAGHPDTVRGRLPGLADWLDAPPVAYAHLPAGHAGQLAEPVANSTPEEDNAGRGHASLLSLTPPSLRMLACKQSSDAAAIVVRLHETEGQRTSGQLLLHSPRCEIDLDLQPFEIMTVRVERDGSHRVVDLIGEQ